MIRAHSIKTQPTTMVSIRELDASIFEGYRQLRLRALKEEPTAFTSSWREEIEKSELAWRERLDSDLYRMFCAVSNQHVLGMSGCRFEAKEKKKHKATLIAVYVEPEFRGQGLGRKLIEKALMSAFKDPLIRAVNLSVTSDNVPAIGLYEAIGFEKWGEEPQAIRVNNTFYAKTCMGLTVEKWKKRLLHSTV